MFLVQQVFSSNHYPIVHVLQVEALGISHIRIATGYVPKVSSCGVFLGVLNGQGWVSLHRENAY